MMVEFDPERSSSWPIIVHTHGMSFGFCVPVAEQMLEELQEAISQAYEAGIGLERR